MPRSRAWMAGGAFAAVIGAMLVLWWIPWLTRQRDVIVSTPSPPGLFGSTIVSVKSPKALCWTNLPVPRRTQVVGVFPTPDGAAPLPPLRVTLKQPGWSVTRTVPAGYLPGTLLRIPVSSPPRDSVGGLCIQPLHGRLAFVATTEGRTRSRPGIKVGGIGVDADVVLTFYRRQPQGIVSRLGDVARQAKVVAAPFVPAWLIVLLMVVTALAIPVGAGLALVRALQDDGG